MINVILCPLCQGQSALLGAEDSKYYKCACCLAVFLHPSAHLSIEDEKSRYLLHNNDVNDIAYQNFVSPVVIEVEKKFVPGRHQGLDFGCGTGPVVAKLLGEKGYNIDLYDPIFCNHPEKLKKTYDFIVCCEVMEHFYYPYREFALLRSLLNPGGALICMTHVYSERTDFKSWYYKNDPTHVIFYHSRTLEWIQTAFGFSVVDRADRRISFSLA